MYESIGKVSDAIWAPKFIFNMESRSDRSFLLNKVLWNIVLFSQFDEPRRIVVGAVIVKKLLLKYIMIALRRTVMEQREIETNLSYLDVSDSKRALWILIILASVG